MNNVTQLPVPKKVEMTREEFSKMSADIATEINMELGQKGEDPTVGFLAAMMAMTALSKIEDKIFGA